MSAFWTSWSNLATDPTSSAAQQTVVNAGQTLASALNAVSSQMNTVMSQAQQQYNTLTGANGQVEQDATQIAALNTQIVQANASGQSPNALLDQRDNLLDSLSGLAQISVTDQSNVRPAFCSGGLCSKISDINNEPNGSAACNQPCPSAPTCKMSDA